MTSRSLSRQILWCSLALMIAALAGPELVAQQQLQFVLAASDAAGNPVTDFKPEEFTMSENGMPAKILKVEPLNIPVRLTVSIDNGSSSSEALAHYRTGLTGLVEALPPDVEVTLITTSPQPRTIVKPTKDRAEILRGITRFGPDQERPRFTDSLVEYAQRLEKDMKDRKVVDFVPVFVGLSTTENEAASYQVNEVEKALTFLTQRKARIFITIFSAKANDVNAVADLNTNRQALISIPLVKATNGKFETLAISNRLATLLPEFGREIAILARKHGNQVRVTVQRPDGLTGNLQNPDIRITRPGVNGAVSFDGL